MSHNDLPAHRRLGVFPRAVQGVIDTFSQELIFISSNPAIA
jgi:hypothetical protein